MPLMGRRIGARTRNRTGTLMDDGETLHADVDPPTPGSDGSGDSGGTIGIVVDIGLGL